MGLDCLETLVGLAENYCECLSGGHLSGYGQSDSGYFIVDSEYGVPLLDAAFANLDCTQETVWDMLLTARTSGIRDFKTDLMQALNVERESGVQSFRGLIAKAEGVSTFPAQEKVFGLQVRPKRRFKDAYFVLSAIHLGISFTGDVEVTISSNDPDFVPQTVTVPVVPNRWNRYALPTAVHLPLYSISISDLRYNVSFQGTAAMRVKSNRIWCCSKPVWMNYFDAAGFVSDSLDDSALATGTNGSGIAIEGFFDCAKLDWICDLPEMNGLDFRDLVARCIQFKAASRVISMILESGRVNYYTMVKAEALQGRRKSLQRMYSENLQWIAQNLPGNLTSCWGCSKRGPKVTSLI